VFSKPMNENETSSEIGIRIPNTAKQRQPILGRYCSSRIFGGAHSTLSHRFERFTGRLLLGISVRPPFAILFFREEPAM
jgi:hypothetical protein